MKRVFARIIAAILLLGFIAGCAADPDMAQEAGSIRVLAPRNDSDGKYNLEISELKGIEDVRTMTGKFVRFFLGPQVVNDHLEGVAPRTRFVRNAEGDYIPSDEMTQQLVSIYFHMQKLAALDEELGAGGVNQWPRDVGVGVRVAGSVTNNAFYDGKTDSMLFVPYTESGLPISVNGGILAHEHFHSLFYKLVLGDVTAQVHNRDEFLGQMGISNNLGLQGPAPFSFAAPEDANMRLYYQTAITRGMNEGLADFWGWMYTGDPDFIVQSLPMVKSTRSLKVHDAKSINSLPTEELILRDLRINRGMIEEQNFNEFITGYSYFLGTQFSRMLKRYSDIYAKARDVHSLQARKEIAKIVIKTLPVLRLNFETLNAKYEETKVLKGNSYTSVDFVNTFIAQAGELRREECEFLAEVANNSKNTDATTKHVCKEQEKMWNIVTEEIVISNEHVILGSVTQ